jgi:adenylate kinase family enzyme
MGASGSGTTTLGAALAGPLRVPQFDTDDFFWVPTEPPYQQVRPREERQRLLAETLAGHPGWVQSGSLCGWGDFLIPQFDLVVFLWIPTELRLQRLRDREYGRFGREIAKPGHPQYKGHREFMAWAAGYDTGGTDMRSLARHRAWLAELPCPVVRLDGPLSVEEGVARVLAALQSNGSRTTR